MNLLLFIPQEEQIFEIKSLFGSHSGICQVTSNTIQVVQTRYFVILLAVKFARRFKVKHEFKNSVSALWLQTSASASVHFQQDKDFRYEC